MFWLATNTCFSLRLLICQHQSLRIVGNLLWQKPLISYPTTVLYAFTNRTPIWFRAVICPYLKLNLHLPVFFTDKRILTNEMQDGWDFWESCFKWSSLSWHAAFGLCSSPDSWLDHGQGAEAGADILQPLADQREDRSLTVKMADGRTEGGCIPDGTVGATMLDLVGLPLNFLFYEKTKPIISLSHYWVTFAVTSNWMQPTLTQIPSVSFIVSLCSVLCLEETMVYDDTADAAGASHVTSLCSAFLCTPAWFPPSGQHLWPCLRASYSHWGLLCLPVGQAGRMFQGINILLLFTSKSILHPMPDGVSVSKPRFPCLSGG